MKDRAAWLKERQSGIGASEIAAVLGLSKFQTALGVYKRKVGEVPIEDAEDAPARRRGEILQRPIIDEYCRQTGAELVAYEPDIVRHPDHKFLLCSLDAICSNGQDEWNTDAKALDSTRAKSLGDEESDDLPDDYFYQGHFQNFVTGRFKTDFAVELGGRWPLRIFTVIYDREFCELLLPELERFWWHVENRKPVDPDFGHATTVKLLRELHPEVETGKRVILPRKFAGAMERYWTLGRIEQKAKELRERIKAEVLFELGGAEYGDIDGAPIIIERQAVSGGSVVNYVTKPYVKMNVKFPRKHQHALAGVVDALDKAMNPAVESPADENKLIEGE